MVNQNTIQRAASVLRENKYSCKNQSCMFVTVIAEKALKSHLFPFSVINFL